MEPLVDENVAAEIIGCSVALMRKWRSLRTGPAYVKVGRLVRYRRADVEAFLDSRRVTAGGA